jgi:outer membrane protein OmpA-like peptidoglycan-associated protein
MRKVLFCLGLLFVASLQLQAQTDPNKNAFSAKVLFLDYGTPNDVDDQNITNGLELTYIRELLPWLNFAIPAKVGVIDVDNDINNRTFFSIDGVLQLQYKKSDTAFITPYLMGGGGITLEEELGSNVQIPVGAGFNFKVGTRSYINLQGEYRISQEENRNNIQLGVGYLHKLGRMDADGDGVVDNLDKCPRDAGSPETDGCPDTDLDGVADIEDKCPARPGKKRFKGCPDTDDDGIMDDEDKCPEVAGLESLMGCPDSDQDGITDAEDDCPQVKGSASANGCPDRDGDGVADAKDQCPDQAGTAENNGCPFKDRDNDGVADSLDECPDEPGTEAANGCPDRDGDGVGDAKDRCPDDAGDMEGCPDTDGDGVHDGKDACIDQPGTAENKGCPELNEEEQEVLSFAMRAVQFETGKARLKEESKEVLDQIVKIMQRYPGYALAINGHTDNVGDAENNKILSEDRARACYAYLVSEGISPKRISFQGFGEEQPIATNDTRSGRRLNRRVEFNLYIE